MNALCRPVRAALITILVLWAAALMLDPGGYLGTDTGGKVATLEAMSQRPLGLDPDVGHWAQRWDPDAEVHGLVYTAELGGRYVNVTTLPMVELGAPLYRLGGYRLALLLPILGAVLAGFAGRSLAKRMGASDGRSWLAYWLVALGSPVTLYALDFWEHTLGLALVAWGVVALIDAVRDDTRWWLPLAAGAAFGAGFSMRTESLVYGFVATALASLSLVGRRRLRRAVLLDGGVLVGLGAMAAANLALEHAALGGSFRSGRATGTATSAGSELALRAKEAILTAFGIESALTWSSLLVATVTSLLVILLMVLLVRGAERRSVVAVTALLGVMAVARMASGPGFVPGMIPTFPLVALGLVVAWPLRHRPAVLLAAGTGLLSLPLVWMFQYTGGAGPQWGGRYILVSALLLGVVGVVGLDRVSTRAAAAVVGASFVIAWLGVGWLVVRSHEVAQAARQVAALEEPVVISTERFWLRELAVEYPGSRWLTVGSRSQLDAAAGIVEQAGFDRFALMEAGSDGTELVVPGFTAAGSQEHVWLGERFRITTYERSP